MQKETVTKRPIFPWAVLNEIHSRRQHQVQKGYDAAHDDEHTDGSILEAAACYIDRAKTADYPWGKLPPGERRDDLIDAAALIVAEIERLDRAGPILDSAKDGGFVSPAKRWEAGKNGWDSSDEATREDI